MSGADIIKLLLAILTETVGLFADNEPDSDTELQALLNAQRRISDAIAEKQYAKVLNTSYPPKDPAP